MRKTDSSKKKLGVRPDFYGCDLERSSAVARYATTAEESSVVQDEGDCIVLPKHTANAFQSSRPQCARNAHCWDGATSACIVTHLLTDRAREEGI